MHKKAEKAKRDIDKHESLSFTIRRSQHISKVEILLKNVMKTKTPPFKVVVSNYQY